MNPQRWQKIDAILDALLDVPPTDRQAMIEHLCKGDPSIRREVLVLLSAVESNSQAIEQLPIAEAFNEFHEKSVLPLPNATLGNYRIVREIGRGGMGIVYSAERAD